MKLMILELIRVIRTCSSRSAEESYLKLNQTVFFSPFCPKKNCVASRYYAGERQAGVLILVLHNLPKMYSTIEWESSTSS